MKKKVNYKSKIDLHYSIENENGLVFESTFEKKPICFTIGDGTIPQKLEITLYGMDESSTQELTLDPKDAFGVHDDNKSKIVKKNMFPNDDMIRVNNVIEIETKNSNGEIIPSLAIIKEIDNENIILDLNHPLAGITIKFKAEIVRIYDE